MRGLRAGGILGAAALSLLGTQAVASAAAAQQPIGVTSTRHVLHAPHLDTAKIAAELTSRGIRAASVQPVSSFRPACYGDSRSIAPVGGILDPVSYGGFYSCVHNTWTFDVQTADSWSQNTLGTWVVGIDTDGNFNDNCGGFEYLAGVVQTQTNGQFTAAVFATDSSCNPIANPVSAVATITANTVAVTFAWSAIGDNPSLAWSGALQSRSEENGNGNADVVPDPNFVDGPIGGAIPDSIQGPTPNGCPASAGTATAGSEVATTPDSHRAATALRQAGFADVRDFGEGVVSFRGDSAAGQRALSAAGIGSQVTAEQSWKADGVLTAGVRAASAGTGSPPNDGGYPAQWNLGVVNGPGAWAVTTGSNVVVADVDTGVDYTHPDFVRSDSSSALVAGFDETAAPPAAITSASGNTDTDGHGTATAGVIAAATNNTIGLASLGWNTRVMPVKVSTDGTFTTAPVAAGIRWAADNTVNPTQVINLSFGGVCPDATIQSAIQYAQGKGILVVAAAGNGALNPGFDPNNGAFDAPAYPAAYPGVLAVGATGRDGYRAAYSNTGAYVAAMAPGGSADGNTADDIALLAPVSKGSYAFGAGTSFSAPQVAAAAALVLSVNPGFGPAAVSQLLGSTTTDLGPPGPDIEYGRGMLNAGIAVTDTPPTANSFGTFVSLPPSRILDTRLGLGAPHAKLGPGGLINLTVSGAGGIPVPGVSAVVLNTTVTDSTAPSFVTVWPTGQSRPNSSNINFLANQTVPNLVTVKVGSGGQVSIYNSSGTANVVADVAGYYTNGFGSAGSTFVSMSPTRLLDTRSSGGPIGGGSSRNLAIAGLHGVPSTATGVVLNVTATDPTAPSFVTVYPEGTARPNASNLNFLPHQTVPNLVSVQLGSGGGISIFNSAGSVNTVADLEGYFTARGDTTGSRFFPVVNYRILDTRAFIGGYMAPIGAHQSIPVAIGNQGGVLVGAAAVVMNTTVTDTTAPSFLTVYPYDLTSPPNASNLNFLGGQTIANLVTVKVGSNSLDKFYNSAGTVDAIADVVGWYGPPGL